MKQPVVGGKPNVGPQIDIRTLPNVECEECHSLNFRSIVRLKRISPLISGNSKEEFVPIELFVCDKCGHLNKNLNPFANIEETSAKSEETKSNLIL